MKVMYQTKLITLCNKYRNSNISMKRITLSPLLTHLTLVFKSYALSPDACPLFLMLTVHFLFTLPLFGA